MKGLLALSSDFGALSIRSVDNELLYYEDLSYFDEETPWHFRQFLIKRIKDLSEKYIFDTIIFESFEEIIKNAVYNLEFWNQFKVKSYHYMKRYLNYIQHIENLNKTRTFNDYSEKHHIVPVSFVVNDVVIQMTAREHYIAHKMLSKCFSAEYNSKMTNAYMLLSKFCLKNELISSSDYEKAKKHLSETTRHKRWVTDEIEDIFIPEELVNDYLEQGYRLGRKRPSEEAIENMRQNALRKMADGTSAIIKINSGTAALKGRTAVSKDGFVKFIKQEDLQKYLSDGYVLGNCRVNNKSRIGMKFVHNDTEQFLVNPDELDKYLNLGYKLGRKLNTGGKS